MKLWIVISGTFGLVSLSGFGLLLAIFGGAGTGNNHQLSRLQEILFTVSLPILPGVCFVAIFMVWRAWMNDPVSSQYWWFALPLPFFVLYFYYLIGFEKNWW